MTQRREDLEVKRTAVTSLDEDESDSTEQKYIEKEKIQLIQEELACFGKPTKDDRLKEAFAFNHFTTIRAIPPSEHLCSVLSEIKHATGLQFALPFLSKHVGVLIQAIATIPEKSKRKPELITALKNKDFTYSYSPTSTWHKRAYEQKSSAQAFKYIADVDLQEPFALLCIAGNLEGIKVFLEENEEILESKTSKTQILNYRCHGKTGFMLAIFHDHTEVVEYLIEKQNIPFTTEEIILQI